MKSLRRHSRSDNLYLNCLTTNFSHEQVAAVGGAFQTIYINSSNLRNQSTINDYIVQVLVPEGLIRVCMWYYKVSYKRAEHYLEIDQKKTNFVNLPYTVKNLC
jgi:hypothetical protein